MHRRMNWGCGSWVVPDWINSDLHPGEGVDVAGDIRDGLPIETDFLDYIVSIHALPMIPYPDLVPVLSELRRMLKPGGVLRLALPDLDKGICAYQEGNRSYFLVPDDDVESLSGKLIVQLLWYGYSVTMFTPEFIEELLFKSGFLKIEHCDFRGTGSKFGGIVELDNREHESLFVEATK
jgi:SAM-dependent methyltransferase